ncbi:MAG: hypothetical protein ACHQC8_01630 [Solirubrobacterales bacterium]
MTALHSIRHRLTHVSAAQDSRTPGKPDERATRAVAVFFGGLTRSTALLILLVVFALVATAYANSRP